MQHVLWASREPSQLSTILSVLVAMMVSWCSCGLSVWHSTSRSVLLAAVCVAAVAMLPCGCAQVVIQQTSEPTELIPPKIDCEVTWDAAWTKCSRDGTQSRRYTVQVYPTRSGQQCPGPQTRPCPYTGPQTIMIDGQEGAWSSKDCTRRALAARQLLAYTGETHERFPVAEMCQYEPVKATVGDVLVFKKAAPTDDVYALPSQWHYAHCNFTDGGAQLALDASSTASEQRYTIRQSDTNRRLYLASSRGMCAGSSLLSPSPSSSPSPLHDQLRRSDNVLLSNVLWKTDTACASGQRVLVSIDDFKQGTLAEAIDLVNKEAYKTEEGADHLVERIWVSERARVLAINTACGVGASGVGASISVY